MATTHPATTPTHPTTAADAWQAPTARAATLADLACRLDAVAARLDRLEHPGEDRP